MGERSEAVPCEHEAGWNQPPEELLHASYISYTLLTTLCFTLLPVCVCRLMGERSEAVPREFEGEVDSIASRLATALASLHEFPAVRYRAGKPPAAGDAPGAAARSLLAQKLAQRVRCGGVGVMFFFFHLVVWLRHATRHCHVTESWTAGLSAAWRCKCSRAWQCRAVQQASHQPLLLMPWKQRRNHTPDSLVSLVCMLLPGTLFCAGVGAPDGAAAIECAAAACAVNRLLTWVGMLYVYGAQCLYPPHRMLLILVCTPDNWKV
jgi:hypothetical protein